jgi:hypothetical protein
MLESQIDQEERRRTLQNDVRIKEQGLDPTMLAQIRELECRPGGVEQAKAMLKEAELKRASTLQQFAQAELETSRDRFGVAQGKPTVVGKAPVDPWPTIPGYWAEADMSPGPTFGVQLGSFDVPLSSIPQEKKR